MSGKRIAVIGASSGIGLELTCQALAAGHEVTGLARHPENCGLEHDRLRLVAGDIRDDRALGQVCEDCAAVCVCVSVPPGRAPVPMAFQSCHFSSHRQISFHIGGNILSSGAFYMLGFSSHRHSRCALPEWSKAEQGSPAGDR